MDKKLKDKTRDLIIHLLTKDIISPVLKFKFIIKADNDKIEKWIRKETNYPYDLYGKYSEEKHEALIQEKVNRFHASKGYNPDGRSYFYMERIVTLDTITFHRFYEVVCGADIHLPVGYEYVGFLS